MLSARIVLPSGVARYYMLAFLSFLEPSRVESLVLQGDEAIIRAKFGSVASLLADGVKIAAGNLKRYHKRWKVEIPGSDNDRKVYSSLMKKLNLSARSFFTKALTLYAGRLNNYRPQDLASAFSSYGKGDIALPSIFKPDHYSFSRAPFPRGREKYNVKVNLDYFMLLLAGYVLSRVGRVRHEARGKQKQEWHTLHIFPYDLKAPLENFSRIIKNLSKEDDWGLPPGLRPEEAVLIWFAMLAPEGSPDVILMSMKDPGKREPAEIGVSYYLPLSTFMARSGQALEKIKENKKASKLLRWLLQRALSPSAGADKARDRAVELVKLLFLALQGMENQRAELLLRASRVEASKAFQGEKDEEYWVAFRGRVLAEMIAQS